MNEIKEAVDTTLDAFWGESTKKQMSEALVRIIEPIILQKQVEVLEEMGNLYPRTKELLDYKIAELSK